MSSNKNSFFISDDLLCVLQVFALEIYANSRNSICNCIRINAKGLEARRRGFLFLQICITCNEFFIQKYLNQIL